MGSRWSLLIKIEYFVEKFAYTNLMKKIFLIISFILFFCNSVFADWEKLGEVERGGEYFVEKDTIIKSQDTYILEDGWLYKTISWFQFLFCKSLYQGDCKVKKIKTLTYVFYTGKKGTGESEQQESENKNWKYPTPESIDFSLLKKLCWFIGGAFCFPPSVRYYHKIYLFGKVHS